MSFLSIKFLLFLVIVFFAYYLTPKKIRWLILLLASFYFYLSNGIALIGYMLFTITTTYFAGRYIHRLSKKGGGKPKHAAAAQMSRRTMKWVVLVTLLLNFGVLAFFKWYNTLAGGINWMLDAVLLFNLPQFDLLLPLGVSFYTFQSVGYLIDIYRGVIEPERNIARFALFVSFFPQIVQGPISRFTELAEQLYTPHAFNFTHVKYGVWLILWGFFKKMVIADRVVVIVGNIFGDGVKYGGFYILIGAVFSAIQIYADFSGGVDIARGAAQTLGIVMPQNFERPYFSTSLPEYWRRWHITLNNWWRDYVFYPLTLSKGFAKLGKVCRKRFGHAFGKMVPVYISVFVVRVINAMWHDANPIYVFSGLYYGVLITLGLMLTPCFNKIIASLRIRTHCFSWRLFQMLRTFFLVSLGRIFVQSPDIQTVWRTYKALFSQFNPHILLDGTLYRMGVEAPFLNATFAAVAVLFVVSVFQEQGVRIRQTLDKQNYIFQWTLTAALLFAILIFGAYGSGYNAANFIYMQF